MRLSRQLILLVTLLIVLLFVGSFSINLNNARAYLATQLASHAQDAATSLGLSVTSHLAEGDQAVAQSMADALFDRGDYLDIRIEQLDGEALVDRSAELRVPGVPAWFVQLVPLDTPLGEAELMRGWRQAGRVLVRSHPGYAYEQLWATARESLLWYGLAGLAVLLLGSLGLRLLLRPLGEVERQAEAICNREFPITERVPFTLEFRRVVEAMNRLSAKVQQMLANSEGLATRLREQAYQDPVTGLANRRQFMEVLNHRVSDPEGMVGGLLLVGLRDFKEYNQQFGFTAGDRLLQAAAQLLQEQLAGAGRFQLARLAGADFAVLLEDADRQGFAIAARRLAEGLAGLCSRVELPSADVGHVGGAYFRHQTAEQLLAEADAALRQAQSAGANASVVTLEGGAAAPERPAGEWRRLVAEALAEDRLVLAWQPVLDCAGQLLHREAFLRMPDPDQPDRLLTAGKFLPLAEASGLAPQLDRFVLGRVLQGLGQAASPVAVNLSPASLEDRELLDWLHSRLSASADLAGRLLLEVSEYGATAHAKTLGQWIERLAPTGVKFSLDQFGRGFSAFRYLRGLKAHYLKIDGSFTRELDRNPDNQFLIQVLCEIAHGLDMRVIAEAVESEAVWQVLPGLGVDGGQGYWLGAPQ